MPQILEEMQRQVSCGVSRPSHLSKFPRKCHKRNYDVDEGNHSEILMIFNCQVPHLISLGPERHLNKPENIHSNQILVTYTILVSQS